MIFDANWWSATGVSLVSAGATSAIVTAACQILFKWGADHELTRLKGRLEHESKETLQKMQSELDRLNEAHKLRDTLLTTKRIEACATAYQLIVEYRQGLRALGTAMRSPFEAWPEGAQSGIEAARQRYESFFAANNLYIPIDAVSEFRHLAITFGNASTKLLGLLRTSKTPHNIEQGHHALMEINDLAVERKLFELELRLRTEIDPRWAEELKRPPGDVAQPANSGS